MVFMAEVTSLAKMTFSVKKNYNSYIVKGLVDEKL